MKKLVVIGLHLGFWLCYLILTIILVYLSVKDADNATVDATTVRAFYFSLIPSILAYYAFYFAVFPILREKKIVKALLSAVGIAIGSALLGNLLIYIFMGKESLTGARESVTTGIVFITFVCLVIGVIGLATKGFITWYGDLKVKEELQQKNHEMEIALVKSQLDPHFLFNTLNNIDILILKSPEEASNYLNKLSDIMRFMLFETKTDRVSLAKEIAYMEKYVALQKIRTSNPNYVRLEVLGSADGKTIAPMVFLPFIENAFKHSTNKKLEDAITLKLQIEERNIRFKCHNKFDARRKASAPSHGLGNSLIEKRLQLLYPEQHRLTMEKTKDSYLVTLDISQ